jgi:hypothetical protein
MGMAFRHIRVQTKQSEDISEQSKRLVVIRLTLVSDQTSESAFLLCRRVDDLLELLAERLFAIGGMTNRVVGIGGVAEEDDGNGLSVRGLTGEVK